MAERRAPVNGHPYGTISWAEHERAWSSYGQRHSQPAEQIARRGGFGITELFYHLREAPRTWMPDDRTVFRYPPPTTPVSEEGDRG